MGAQETWAQGVKIAENKLDAIREKISKLEAELVQLRREEAQAEELCEFAESDYAVDCWGNPVEES